MRAISCFWSFRGAFEGGFRRGLLGCLLMFCSPVVAVDPLPPHIETAPLPVREAYMERIGRESLREKIEVGRERYAERVERKKALIDAVRRRAQTRTRSLEEIRTQMSGGSEASTTESGARRWTGMIWLAGFGAFLMLMLRRIMAGRWHFD